VTNAETGPGERPSRRVVDQRIRNRVIEYFEVAASFEAQRKCERDIPIVHVPYEVISEWKDWVWKDPRQDSDLPGIYTQEEFQALCDYQVVWEVATKAVPDDFPSLAQVQALPDWGKLRSTAESALAVFGRRGKMPEDNEVPEAAGRRPVRANLARMSLRATSGSVLPPHRFGPPCGLGFR